VEQQQEKLSFKEGLLKARSHIVFIIGLIAAFGIVMKLESWKSDEEIARMNAQAPVREFNLENTVNIPTPARVAALSEQEMQWARTAWKYFENNTQPTGLANSVDNFPSTTMWDMGSYLLALISAERLEIINKAEFDKRMAAALTSLEKLPLFDGVLPNKAYNTMSGEMTDYNNQPNTRGLGWSALDMARIMVPLNIIVWNYPEHAKNIKGIINRWKLNNIVKDGELQGAGISDDSKTQYWQEGRLGYEEYAAKPFNLLDMDVSKANRYGANFSMVNIFGIDVPVDSRKPEDFGSQNYVISEPYILDELEFGWDAMAKELAYRVYRAQEERFKKTGILTAVTEDHVDRAPYFVYNTVYSGGKEWRCIDPGGKDVPDLRSLSTKAAFGWDAVFKTNYTKKLVDKVQSLNDPARGWYAGVYEKDQQTNKSITCNTNAVVLEALAYKKFGPAFTIGQ
jgi:hypothetical protein